VQRLERRIIRLQHQVDVATERYNRTREGIHSAQVRLRAARVRVAQQQQQVQLARESLGLLAADLYRRGHLSTLDIMLSEEPQDLLAQAGLAASMTSRRADLVHSLAIAEQRLVQDADRLAAEEVALQESRRRLAAERRAVLRRLTRAQVELTTLSYGDRQWLARTSRDRERQAILDALRSSPVGDVPDAAGGVQVDCMGVPVLARDGRAARAVAFACGQIGDPYLWAAEGPDAWDCSGLTMAAWGSAGVALPHSASMQHSYGTRVSRGRLQPGDLVFFHSPISHVGIYIGRGLMVHSPHSGDRVKISALFPGFSGAVRL
jgi:hypothetical protein